MLDITYLFRFCIYSCLILCICKLVIYIEVMHLANFVKEIFLFAYKLVTYNMYNVDKYNVNIHIYTYLYNHYVLHIIYTNIMYILYKSISSFTNISFSTTNFHGLPKLNL